MTDHRTQHPHRDRDTNADSDQEGNQSADHKTAKPTGTFWAQFGQVGGLWEEPINWAFPILRIPKKSPILPTLTIRIHIFLLVLGFVFVARAIWPPAGHPFGGDWTFTLLGIATLLIAIIIHEAAHLAINRFIAPDAESKANEVTLWPLGGLSSYELHQGPKPDLLIALAGPLANLALCLILSPILALYITHDWATVIFNPLDPTAAFSQWSLNGKPATWALGLWLLNYTSFIIFILNLLPIYPLDGANITHQLFRSRNNHQRTVEITTGFSYATALILATLALFLGSNPLLALAIFGGVMSYLKRRQIAFLADPLAIPDQETPIPAPPPSPAPPAPPSIIPLADPAPESSPQVDPLLPAIDLESDLDQILEKISLHGVESLTSTEKVILDQATKRKRRES